MKPGKAPPKSRVLRQLAANNREIARLKKALLKLYQSNTWLEKQLAEAQHAS